MHIAWIAGGVGMGASFRDEEVVIPRRLYRPRSAVPVLAYMPQSPVRRTNRPSTDPETTFVPGNRG